MIIYENPDHQFSSTGYDATYAADPRHFTHRSTFEALDTLFTEHLQIDRPLWCLDLGCGQGQVAAKVHDIIGERAPNMLQDSRTYGLDLSPVAIRQCDESYPDLLWINDTLQDFLKREDTKRDLFGRFDLVINKGGLTFVSSEDEYDELLEGIHALLGEGGRYLYIQNKKFYAKWSNQNCRGWSHDIFDIAGERFGTPTVIDNKGYFVDIYTKRPASVGSNYKPAADEPLVIEFTLNSGQIETWFVGGDEAIARQTKFLCADPDDSRLLSLRTVPRGSPQARTRHTDLAAATASSLREGDLVILVPTHRVLRPDGRRGGLTPGLYDALTSQGISPLHHPADCLTTREYCNAVNEWIASRPDAILLGLGLEDYRRNAETATPLIDLDEFTARVDWLTWKLQRETQARLIWLWLELDRDITSPDGLRAYRHEDARAFQQAVEPFLRMRGVHVEQITHGSLISGDHLDLPRTVQRISGIICNAVKQESVAR